ncbi:MAG: bifunctional phosphoribosylaminoimidazolecarboxamide formyltransferase/IMP cyclohydrolase [Thermoguttaceae bacterium]|nr:bifunctional phosphoribosylaminoimidazolecarboxamide formyltransferase/IMP cyclohydrolase [Thermoguttaceae bacterium]
MDSPQIKRALISVSDKFGLEEFARGLVAAGVEIFSTGGTRRHLETNGIPVKDITEYTGFPEMMGGRLKTLHPLVHGGILCRRDSEDDMKSAQEHGIVPFELVVVNLYPFEATVARENVTDEEAIENIDIGGPTMVRAAAKNHQWCAIVTNSEQYPIVLEQIQSTGSTTLQLRRSLAKDAFTHTAAYDTAISRFFSGRQDEEPFPTTLSLSMKRSTVLRYGENPHQQAALYKDKLSPSASVVAARQLNGKDLSYNNILDLDAALAFVRSFKAPTVAVLKHNNPCGAASDDSIAVAVQKAMAGDPLSAFGSVLGFNREVDAQCAEYLCTPGLFVEAIVAPTFDPKAVELLTTKPKWHANVRLLECGSLDCNPDRWSVRILQGGALLQEADTLADPEEQWRVVTDKAPAEEQLKDLRFAWQVVRHVKSNAIVICKDSMLLGTGAGQMSRVDSVEISVKKAGDRIEGAVLASDAFFPFPDGIEAARGVTAVIQPGGSRNDEAVIEACNKLGIAMVFTGRRHFKH